MNIIRLGGFLAACALLTAPADARDLKTISGDVFKNITLSKKDATGIQITHDDGVAFIDFKNLSAAEQKEFGYDPATYATGWVQKIAADKQRQQQQALAAQQAAARAKAQAAQAPVQETWKPTNPTGLEVTIDSPGFRYGPYQYYGRGFSNTIPPSQGGQLVPYPYNANGPYPYYNGATWGPTIIRQR